eukprot:9161346-Pyramimonas_sp.AAC.1
MGWAPSESIPNIHHLRGRVALLIAAGQNLERELRRSKTVTDNSEEVEVGPLRITSLRAEGHYSRAASQRAAENGLARARRQFDELEANVKKVVAPEADQDDKAGWAQGLPTSST